MVKGALIVYKLVCLPDSRDLEPEVNRIIQENFNSDIELPPLQITEKYSKSTEVICPKCSGQVIEDGQGGFCTGCKRTFDKAQMKSNERTRFTRSGNFFIQEIIIRASQ